MKPERVARERAVALGAVSTIQIKVNQQYEFQSFGHGTVVDSLLEHKPGFVDSCLTWMPLVDRRPSALRSCLALQSGDSPSVQSESESKQ